MWSSIAEVVAILVGANAVVAFGRPDWVLPVTALAVGAHFLPIGWSMPQPAFVGLGGALLVLGGVGLLLPAPSDIAAVGLGGCLLEWTTSCWIIYLLRVRARPAGTQG